MKKLLLLAMILLLAACGNDGSGDEAPDDDSQDSTEEPSESASDEGTETAEEEGEVEAPEIIEEANSAWGDTVSYEARQTSTVSSGDSQYAVRMITTRSEQNEIKVEVDDGAQIQTHYVIDGEHFIYQDGSVEAQDQSLELENSAYGELLAQLEPLSEGTVSEQDTGYEIRYEINSREDAIPFFDDEVQNAIQDVDMFNGLVTVQFNEDYQYIGAELTLTVGSEQEELNITSNITMDRIGEIDLIEKPKEM
ncbi:hypothetical protein ACFOLA_02435 [Salinicoccus hispanicus]|uniref:Uncharacterized protein n=1 Tax=Salinicoccus hispanicus TaxID=157225 RepID=A0A6N8U2Q3_9STAP|nr:hypothetical protein [Salinicoccus hispanicus]MXQ50441.1 hypothetical protein [Salinicoccus hispanicus]